MTLAARVGRRSGEGLLVVALGAGLGVALAIGIAVAGPLVALLPLAVVACWWLVLHPVATLGLLFTTTVLFEESAGIWPVSMDRWYAAMAGVVHGPDILIVLLAVAVIREERAARTPGPGFGRFALPLGLLAVATAGGVITGVLAGGDPAVIFNSARVLAYLMVVPWLAATVLVRHRLVRPAVLFALGVICVRAIAGLLTWFVHGRFQGTASGVRGVSASINASASTFYEPTMNFLMVLVVLGVVAALAMRHRVPRWLLVLAPVVAVTLILSYRRSFWIALALGLVLVLVVATGQRGRAWLVLGAAAMALSLYLAMSAGGVTDTTNPVVYRAQSLTPSKLLSSSDDRYRLDEQRNVIAEIRAHPLTGLGLGVPWTARYPLFANPPGGRLYTHVTPLWYWLKLGPFGFVSYLWIAATAIFESYWAWRRGRDPVVRIAGVALAAGFIGLLVAELTGPFSGIDVRMTLIAGCLFGWLIAVRALRAQEVPQPEAGTSSAVPVEAPSRWAT